jgi:molybdate transport system regulatory protein
MNMQPRFNVWIEVDEQVALSIWRADLLRAIATSGSISAAAEQMNVPYRTAWQKVHEMEERLGIKLLETQTGGVHGGGAQLTPVARQYLQKLEQLYALLRPLVDSAFHQVFDVTP